MAENNDRIYFENEGYETENYYNEETQSLDTDIEMDYPLNEVKADNEKIELFHSNKKILQRELKAEALARLENSARTVDDYNAIIEQWNKLDENRERRERYHEVGRSGDTIPLDQGAKVGGATFPRYINSYFERQIRNGEFIDVVYNCPHEIHQLVTSEYLSNILKTLSDNQKELLYLSAVKSFNSKYIGEVRGQSDRNIRKVRANLIKKLQREVFIELIKMKEENIPLSYEEEKFARDRKVGLDFKNEKS